MEYFKIRFCGYAHIDNWSIPIEHTITIEAKSEQEAKDKAYEIAKKAYLTWDYVIN